MNKKELENLRQKVRADNPLLTDEQIEDIVAESENSAGEANSKETGQEATALSKEKEALAKEKELLEAEKAAIAKEKAELEVEKKALAEEKAAIAAANGAYSGGKTGTSDGGKAITYECKARCTFNGQYYREGDRLTTADAVPDFFQAVKESAGG